VPFCQGSWCTAYPQYHLSVAHSGLAQAAGCRDGLSAGATPCHVAHDGRPPTWGTQPTLPLRVRFPSVAPLGGTIEWLSFTGQRLAVVRCGRREGASVTWLRAGRCPDRQPPCSAPVGGSACAPRCGTVEMLFFTGRRLAA
jgi:hypothetical protein